MSLGRREVLQTFLGLPAALAACGRTGARTPPMPGGEIVFAGERMGHMIRDQLAGKPGAGRPGAIRPDIDSWEQTGVVIIGGGAAGLAAAWRLMGAGFDDFVVLELESAVGGTSRSGQSKTGAYPWGAHYITAPMQENRALVRLLDDMSVFEHRTVEGEPVVAEQYLCRDPEERLYFRGRWYEGLYLHAGASAQDRAQHRAFEAEIGRLAGWRDSRGRRGFALPLSQSSDDAEMIALDRISMAQWMDERGLTSPRLRWYVDYACRDDYGLGLAHTSAWAGLFYYVSRVRGPGEDYQPVVTWPEGNGKLIAHMAAAAGPRARPGWAVAHVRHTSSMESAGVEVVALTEGGARAAGIRAEQVIFAAPQFLTPYVIDEYRDSPPAHISDFDYGPWMVANLALRERPIGAGFPLCWDNVFYNSPSLGYVVSTHQRGLDHGPTMITYYYPLLDPDSRAARRTLLDLGWRDWADVALTDIERAHHNIRSITERIDIVRWGHAMIRPRPGFIWSRARARAAEPYRSIHFAHSDLSGVALFDEALDNGVRAAEEVLARRGIARQTWR